MADLQLRIQPEPRRPSRALNVSHSRRGTRGRPFGYTPANQVRTATTSTAAYDWINPGVSTTNKTADGLNRDATFAAVGSPCGATGAGYDCNGNLAFDGTRTFTYDHENRLIGETGPVTLALAYDPLGRLRQETVNGVITQFLYDGDALVAEYDGSNTLLRRYVHGPAADNPLIGFEGSTITAAGASYLIADRQGSIIATANTSGVVTASYTYDAYGMPNAWAGARFRYTGQIVLPEAQLYHYKARAYDPNFGHFLQTDPVGYGPDVNWYAYVGDDPIDRTDPSGAVPNVKLDMTAVVAKARDGLETYIKGFLGGGAAASVVVPGGAALAAVAVPAAPEAAAIATARGAAAVAADSGASGGATSGFVARSGQAFAGASTRAGGPGAATNSIVQKALDSVAAGSRSAFHGCCGEINAFSNAANAGARLEGGVVATVRAVGRGAGDLMEACSSCQAVAKELGIRVVSPP